MKLSKFAYFIFKTTWKSYFKNNEKNTWKFTKKTWKNHGNIMEFCQSEKVGTLCMKMKKIGPRGCKSKILLYSSATGCSGEHTGQWSVVNLRLNGVKLLVSTGII